MKSELQLLDSLAQIPRANNDEQVHKKAAASATIEKCSPAAAVKLQKQRMYVLKLTMPEIRALSLFTLRPRSPNKGNKEMVERIFAVLMEKSPGVVSVISAYCMAPPVVTEVNGDRDA
jgi:hypothetical protein